MFGFGVFGLCPINFLVEGRGRDNYRTVRNKDIKRACNMSMIGCDGRLAGYLGLK